MDLQPLIVFQLYCLVLHEETYAILLYPYSPYDALKHHSTSLKAYLIFLQSRVLEQNFHKTCLPIHGNFLQFLNHIVIFIHYKSRIVTAIRGL